jgi:hypothetical protein
MAKLVMANVISLFLPFANGNKPTICIPSGNVYLVSSIEGENRHCQREFIWQKKSLQFQIDIFAISSFAIIEEFNSGF